MSLATLLREIEVFLADFEHQDLALLPREDIEAAVREFVETRTQESADRVAVLMAQHAAWAYDGGADAAIRSTGLRVDSPVPTARLEPVMLEAYRDIRKTFGGLSNDLLGTLHRGISGGRSYPEIRAAMTRQLEGYFKDGIPFDNKGQWRRTIKVDPNGKMRATKHRISRNVTLSPENYADVLTKTVAKRAYAQGHVAGYESAGIKAWRYTCVADERSRLRHLALHGRVFVIGSPEEALALEVMGEPRCRCRPVPYYGDPNLDTPEEAYRVERIQWAKEAMQGLDPGSDEAKFLERVASGKMLKPPAVPHQDPLAVLPPPTPAPKPSADQIWGRESPRSLAVEVPTKDVSVLRESCYTLSDSERAAVEKYSDTFYDPINLYFREGEQAFLKACKSVGTNPEEVRYTITKIEAAIAKGRLATDRTLWRGVRGKHGEINLQVGDRFPDAAYTSWSYDQATASGFSYAFSKHPETGKPTKILFRYQARQGEHALFVGNEGALAPEAEVILGRGRTWRVADIIDHDRGEQVLREIVLEGADYLGPESCNLRDWEPWIKTRMAWTREAADTLTAKRTGYASHPQTLATRIIYGRDVPKDEIHGMGAALFRDGLVSVDGPRGEADRLLDRIIDQLPGLVHQDVIRRAGPVKVVMRPGLSRPHYNSGEIHLPKIAEDEQETWRMFLHEYGHHLEQRNSRYAHNAMLAARARDNGFKLRRVKDLFPEYDYRADEITFAGFDHIHPYAGKVYPMLPGNKTLTNALKEGELRAIRAGETISMGLEQFAGVFHARELLEKDPEYFSFILTIMAGLG